MIMPSGFGLFLRLCDSRLPKFQDFHEKQNHTDDKSVDNEACTKKQGLESDAIWEPLRKPFKGESFNHYFYSQIYI